VDSVIRGVAVYLVLLIVLRLSGRRTLAQMTPFDLILLLIIAETSQQALLGDDFSIINSVVLIVTLCSVDILLSYLKRSSPRVERLLDGAATVLISRGEPDAHALRRARVDLEDVMDAAREQHGLERLDQIKFAVLEVSGTISIVPTE
jgi:uncharacterized membrane protein YcaP (DUF421 family)